MTTDSETLLGPTMRSAKGNVPQSIKDSLAEWYSGAAELQRFAAPIARRLEATEMSVYDKTEEPGKKEAKMVFEIDVTEGEYPVVVKIGWLAHSTLGFGQICATLGTASMVDVVRS